jgi:hypothetical protein
MGKATYNKCCNICQKQYVAQKLNSRFCSLDCIYAAERIKKVQKRLSKRCVHEQGELWLFVVGSENKFAVSNLGRVKRMYDYPTKTQLSNNPNDELGCIKPLYIKPDGYAAVGAFIHGKNKPHSVHRLVAEAFIPNPENKLCVNHINSNRSDNRVENLEWVTHRENIIHSMVFGKKTDFGEGSHRAKLKQSDVDNIRILLNKGANQTEISKIYNVAPSTINNISTGKRWNNKFIQTTISLIHSHQTT